MKVDVAIVGGGPGGCTAAISLRAFAPSLSVTLVEASRYDVPRIGETLPPPARPLLEHLGVWEAFREQGHRPVYGTSSAWGGEGTSDNDFVFSAAGNGWHLDRAVFDAMLATEAEKRGATVLRGVRVREATDCWSLALDSGERVDARFLIDATGGAAHFARLRGASFVTADRLTAFARFFDDPGGDPRTIVEAFEDGWWYTAALPDGRRIAACMTDVDVGRRLALADAEAWSAHLAMMPHLGKLLGEDRPHPGLPLPLRRAQGQRQADPLPEGEGGRRAQRGGGVRVPLGEVIVRPAESRRLDPAAGDDWLAVGDAASRFDPLSSQGILKALRSGVFASYAVADRLLRNDDSGLHRYRAFIRGEFESYLEVRGKVYAEEGRWKGKEFWDRRRPVGKSSRQSLLR